MLKRPTVLHCLGGFVIAMQHGLPRPTVDVDCLAVLPVEDTGELQSLAGQGSALHHKSGVYVQHAGIVTVPENYPDRLVSMFPQVYCRLVLMGLEAHDLALSKLERNSARDREDLRYLSRSVPLDVALLEARHHSELRPYLAHPERHDLTLLLWLEMLRGES